VSILITAANSAQAYQLKGILKDEAEIVLGDYLEIPDLMVKTGKMIRTPDPKGLAFIHEVLALCLDKGINKVYALRRAELLPLAEARQLFAEFDITLYIPSKEIIADAIPHEVTGGQIVIVENGNVIAGDLSYLASGEGWRSAVAGVFKVNAEGYTIFTAD
jgi:hypothetical protein